MIEEIYDAISMAQHDRRRLNQVVSLAKSVPKMGNEDTDQLLDRLAEFHEELQQRRRANSVVGEPVGLHPPLVRQLPTRE